MKMGDPLDEATDIGTIVSPQQFEKVNDYIRIGEATPGMRAMGASTVIGTFRSEHRFQSGGISGPLNQSPDALADGLIRTPRNPSAVC